MENINKNHSLHSHSHSNSTEKKVDSNKEKYSMYVTPVAIIIAGIIIALSLHIKDFSTLNKNNKNVIQNSLNGPKPVFVDLKSTDHIRGSKDAKILIIEYSDIECPFCKIYHETMKKIYNEFSKNNDIAWVYRHFPMSYGDNPRHKDAAKKAEATECAAELGGENMFWSYIDSIYEKNEENGLLELSELSKIAANIGLDESKFKECLDSGKYSNKIKDSYDEALKSGASGTPHTIIKYKGEFIPLVDEKNDGLGALPYQIMKEIVNNLLLSENK